MHMHKHIFTLCHIICTCMPLKDTHSHILKVMQALKGYTAWHINTPLKDIYHEIDALVRIPPWKEAKHSLWEHAECTFLLFDTPQWLCSYSYWFEMELTWACHRLQPPPLPKWCCHWCHQARHAGWLLSIHQAHHLLDLLQHGLHPTRYLLLLMPSWLLSMLALHCCPP